MSQPLRQVAIIQIIGAAAQLDEFVQQLAHDDWTIVDALQQNRLIAGGYAGVDEPLHGLAGDAGTEFERMIEMGVEPKRVVAPQHGDERRRDALGHYDGHARSDADDLDMIDPPQLGQNVLESIIAQAKRLASRDQHVADRGCRLDVIDCGVDLLAMAAGAIANDSSARAITAI